MPYLIQGTASQLGHLFNAPWLTTVRCKEKGASIIERDLHRTHFLGSVKQAQHHVAVWKNEDNKEFYIQGNMTAGCLFDLPTIDLFKKENEADESYYLNKKNLHFAYVNEQQELCGCMLFYRKDNPSQWLIALSRNNASAPDKRQISLLTSEDISPYIVNPNDLIRVEEVDRVQNKLFDEVGSRSVIQLLEGALAADSGEINLRIKRILCILRFLPLPTLGLADPIDFEQLDLSKLFAENPVLDVLTEYHQFITSSMLLDCLSESRDSRKLLEDANRLRHITVTVEATCKKIQKQLSQSDASSAQRAAWSSAEEEYKKALYELAYFAIQDPTIAIQPKLKTLQDKILNVVDPEIRSWAHKALIVIANIFIAAFTFTLANQIKYQKTGNFWFFNQSASGEVVRALGREIEALGQGNLI